MKRASHLSRSQYAALITEQVREIFQAIEARQPVTSLDTFKGCPATFEAGYASIIWHTERKYVI